MSQGIVSGVVDRVAGPRAGEIEIGVAKRPPAETAGISRFIYSPPPSLWSGITMPLVTALLSATPTCDEADKLKKEGEELHHKAYMSQTEDERVKLYGDAAEKFKAAAAKYKECNNPGEEAAMISQYRDSYFSTNKVVPEERSKVYRAEAEAFVRAANSARDISQKIRYLWQAGEAQMRIGEGEVNAANGFYDAAYELSFALKAQKYEHAADSRHKQAEALKRAVELFTRPDLMGMSNRAEREAAELTVLRTKNYHAGASLMAKQGDKLLPLGRYEEALNAYINSCRLYNEVNETGEAQGLQAIAAVARYGSIFGKLFGGNLTPDWAKEEADKREKDGEITTAIGLLRVAASLYEADYKAQDAQAAIKKAVSFPEGPQLAILNNYVYEGDKFLGEKKLLDALTEYKEGLLWVKLVMDNLDPKADKTKLEAAVKLLEAGVKKAMDAIDARWK